MMRTTHVFLEVDMRMGHPGLTALAGSKNVYALDPGSGILFLNRKLNKAKVLTPCGVLSYLRLGDDEGMSLKQLNAFPHSVDPELEMSYSDGAMRVLKKLLGDVKDERSTQDEGKRDLRKNAKHPLKIRKRAA